MKKGLLATLVLALLLLATTGCLLSLRPLYNDYDDEDLVFEPALLGVWVATSPEGTLVVLVQESGSKPNEIKLYDTRSYDITVVGTGTREDSEGISAEDTSDIFPMKYRGWLVRVGDSLFLDLVAHEDVAGGLSALGLLSTHMFFRVELHGDLLQVEMVNDKLIEDPDERYLRHESLELFSPTLLTAFPGKIKQRLKKHPGDSAIYDELLQLRRVN